VGNGCALRAAQPLHQVGKGDDMTINQATVAVAAIAILGGCSGTGDISQDEGQLIGAAGGAAAGATLGDGGIIAPAIGAIGGAVIGEEASDDDPLFE
jgi:hypothetical protein